MSTTDSRWITTRGARGLAAIVAADVVRDMESRIMRGGHAITVSETSDNAQDIVSEARDMIAAAILAAIGEPVAPGEDPLAELRRAADRAGSSA